MKSSLTPILPILPILRWLAVALGSLLITTNAYAALNITSATVNGGTSVTVAAGAKISATVNETSTNGTNWRSVYWTIGTGVCVNTTNYWNSGNYSETFNITAPSTSGTYDATFVAYSNDNCSGTSSNTYTLTNGVTVATAVTSIALAGATPTNAASVSWTVTFSGNVSGVSASNFSLVNSGLGGSPTITNVSGGGTTWTVTASTGTGSGTLQLNMSNATGVTPTVSGTPYTGATYTIDHTPPSVSSITRANSSPTALTSVSWTVTFSEDVTGVDATDFALAQSGVNGASITSVTQVSNTIYTVTVNTGTGNGTLGLNLVDNDSITDTAGNPLGGTGAGNGDYTGEVYAVSRPVSVTGSPSVCVNDNSNGSTYSWSSLGSVGASDNSYAQANGYNGSVTQYLKCTGYGFNIPSGATITGIVAGVQDYSQKTFYDQAVQLVKGGTIQSTNYGTNSRFPNPEGYTYYGGNSDLWGNSWTTTDINSGNFGVAFAAQRGPYNSTDTAYVDYMPITVSYTIPAGPTVVSIALAGTNPTNAATVSWTVTFSESVTGVSASNFQLVASSLGGAPAIAAVSGSGTTWTVTASTGTGTGTLGLNMANQTNVTTSSGKALVDVPFTGDVYTISSNTRVVNTYYPGTASISAGATSIVLGAAAGATPISSGDLVLIMQMQDATINYNNSDSYGDGTSSDKIGTGATSIGGSGLFEYAVASNTVPLSGGTLSLPCGTLNAYTDSDATSASGQRRFQVIRVPIYTDSSLSSSFTALPWNGGTGGVLALDDTGTLNLNSATISVDGDGFRGGAARNSSTGSGSASDFVTPVSNGANGTKGEGIAGTPYYVFTAPSTMTNTGIDGYPGGSFARGAPANAGGGGTDIDPPNNDENSGGGGGANGGGGGLGGIGWCQGFNTTAPYYGCGLSSLMVASINPNGSSGGFGGSAVTGLGSARLILGGGGGSGTTNNGTGNLSNGLASSGAAGGGIIMIRAANLSGSATFSANGSDGDSTVDNDGGGGGGAGGAVLISASSGLGGVTINAKGGNGGSTVVSHSYTPHGPGGGGGGGFAITSSTTAACNTSGGQNGTTYDYGTAFGAYGSSSGSGGSCVTGLASGQIPGATLGGAGACPSSVGGFLIDPGTSPASTCVARGVTITARDSAGATLTNYVGTISISTSSGHGDWSLASGSGTFAAGAADSGTATYTFVTGDAGVVSLSLANTHADDLTISVNDSSASVTSTSSPALSFRDDVFVISPTTCTGGSCTASPPTGSTEVVAGRPHGMQAALWTRDSANSNSCSIDTRYNATGVKGWYNPDTSDPAGAAAPSVNDGTNNVTLPSSTPGSNNLALNFTSGVATFTLNTTDVGKYTLSLLDDSSKFAKDSSGNARPIAGSSGTLTVRPFAIDLRNVQLADGTKNPGATTPGANTKFTCAGCNFEGTAKGVLWDSADDGNNDGIPDSGADLSNNGVTPSYAWPTTVVATTPFTPGTAVGGTIGTLSNGALAASSFSGGSASATTLQYNEVGSVTLQPHAAASFLGTSNLDIPYASVVVGRFSADHFTVAIGSGSFAGTDGTFTYLGQNFVYKNAPTVTVEAFAADGHQLNNYEGSFWLLGSGILNATGNNGFQYTDAAASFEGGSSLTTSPTSTISYGDTSAVKGKVNISAIHTGTNDVFMYSRTATPITPFDADVKLSVQVTDTDGATSNKAVAEMGFANDSDAPSSTSAFNTTNDKTLRWGRITMQNANGPELADLQVPMTAEYYSGNGFVPNTDDSTTTLTGTAMLNLADISPGALISTPLTCVQDPNTPPGVSGYGCGTALPPTEVGFTGKASGGQFDLWFKAPNAGTGHTGSFTATASVPTWLRYPWTGGSDVNPFAVVTFGVFQGNPKDIYLRELY